jgi:hypothetical protein
MITILNTIERLGIRDGVTVAPECIRYHNCVVGLLTREEEARAAILNFAERLLDAGCGDLDLLSVAVNKPIYMDIPCTCDKPGVGAVVITEKGTTVVMELVCDDEVSATAHQEVLFDQVFAREANGVFVGGIRALEIVLLTEALNIVFGKEPPRGLVLTKLSKMKLSCVKRLAAFGQKGYSTNDALHHLLQACMLRTEMIANDTQLQYLSLYRCVLSAKCRIDGPNLVRGNECQCGRGR